MTVEDRILALKEHMATQLRAKGATFQEVATNAGRRVPRRYRNDVAKIIEVETLIENPKLAHRIEDSQVAKAERRLRYFLDQQDPKAERLGEILDWIAAVAFIVVVITLGVFFYLISTGYFE